MARQHRTEQRISHAPPQIPFWLTPRTAHHPGNPCGSTSWAPQAAMTEPLTCVGSRSYFRRDNGRDGEGWQGLAQIMGSAQLDQLHHFRWISELLVAIGDVVGRNVQFVDKNHVYGQSIGNLGCKPHNPYLDPGGTFGIILGQFWYHFGSILAPFMGPF